MAVYGRDAALAKCYANAASEPPMHSVGQTYRLTPSGPNYISSLASSPDSSTRKLDACCNLTLGTIPTKLASNRERLITLIALCPKKTMRDDEEWCEW